MLTKGGAFLHILLSLAFCATLLPAVALACLPALHPLIMPVPPPPPPPPGLEDYAKPIIDALDPHGAFFTQRIYREGTVKTDYYQCVKDMARINRDPARTVLVDDTPLAFLHQPGNGVPVLGFRGDPDDRLLGEAVMPLLQVCVPVGGGVCTACVRVCIGIRVCVS